MLLNAQLSPEVAWYPSCTPTTSADPHLFPQSEWYCLNLVGGRALTALGTLTQAPICPPFLRVALLVTPEH